MDVLGDGAKVKKKERCGRRPERGVKKARRSPTALGLGCARWGARTRTTGHHQEHQTIDTGKRVNGR